MPNNAIRIIVGIADVDSLVPQGTPLDLHAGTNCTSVYTGIDVFPMLPEKLSTDLTSLNEGEDRLAIAIETIVDEQGDVVSYDVYRAMVHNKAKLAYEAVGAFLDGEAPPQKVADNRALAEQLTLQDEASRRLKAERARNGALELDTIEATPVAKDGRIVDLKIMHKNRARDLIEDFMIASNVAIAKFLESKGRSGIRRVVREPERWARIVELAGRYGATLPDDPDSIALAHFLIDRRKADPDRFPDLSLAIVKLMGPGIYALDLPGKDPGGHFGLATHDYSHATAPNRRYADLVTQRLVKAALADKPAPYTNEELAAVAEHVHRARRRGEQGRTHGAKDGCGAAPQRPHRRDVRRHRHRREPEGHVRSHDQAAGRRHGRARPRRVRRRRQGARQTRRRRPESRLHRFRGAGEQSVSCEEQRRRTPGASVRDAALRRRAGILRFRSIDRREVSRHSDSLVLFSISSSASRGPQLPAAYVGMRLGLCDSQYSMSGSITRHAASTSSLRVNSVASPIMTSSSSVSYAGAADFAERVGIVELHVDRRDLDVRRQRDRGARHLDLEVERDALVRLHAHEQRVGAQPFAPRSRTSGAAARGTARRSPTRAASAACRIADRTARRTSASCRCTGAAPRTSAPWNRARRCSPPCSRAPACRSSTPAVYCARTACCAMLSGVSARIDCSTFTFSSRTAFADICGGGSMAVSVSSCSRWFWNMSRSTPASS